MLEGYSGWVCSVAFSTNSKLLASALYDDTIKIWDAAIGTLQQMLEGHSDWVHSVAFSTDSKLLVSASNDCTIKIWDAATGTLQQTLEGHSDSVNSVAFSTDSKLLVSASRNRTIKIWNTLEGYSGWVHSVAFSTDSKLLILEGHNDSINSIAFSADSKLLTSASNDSTIKIWDAATGTLQQTLENHISTRNLLFDITNSILIIDTSYFKLNINSNIPLPSSSQAINNRSHHQGLSINKFWVIWNDQNLLWLPPDFRSESFTISHTGSKLAIECRSGRVFIIEIDNPYSNIL
ncbi:hypothetical protein BPAE_0265g00130 [Botrytis paeoniae]|uniref:Uncharacterized protein n=1 Tax=Botrytis paeoniae TaxID=278948 RepID=A0A4Z1FB81_9HELO|nr:hypothetical protein BPAE_0265g00130 [Botrytis paeoniae]